MFRRGLFAAVLAAPCAAAPASPQVNPAPSVEYRSAFDGYRPWSAESARDWREVNAEVERLGGHAGHLRAAPAAPAVAPAAPGADRATPADPTGHGGHRGDAAEKRR